MQTINHQTRINLFKNDLKYNKKYSTFDFIVTSIAGLRTSKFTTKVIILFKSDASES